MIRYFSNSKDAAAYVADQLPHLKPDSQWTMTITRTKSEVLCVHHAIVSSSEDIELQRAKFFSDTQLNT
jgi:hypothetical protein